jgi:hypothetical protein
MTTEQTVVELRPGQKIEFVTEAVQTTPFGQKVQEVRIPLTYEEILERFKTSSAPGVRKQRLQNVPSQVREFNRYAAISTRVFETGKWTTGAVADPKQVAKDLVSQMQNLPETLLPLVSTKARAQLQTILGGEAITDEQKTAITNFLTTLPA